MRNMCIIVITFLYISCRRRNHRTGNTHSGGEHSDQGFPCCSLFHSIIPLKLFFIVVCLLLLWKRSRCEHCVVMRIGTTSSEIFGICLSILYHAFCRKSIVGSAKEYVRELCKMMGLIRGVMVAKVTFDNVCTHPEAYAWVRSAARRWMGEQQSPRQEWDFPSGGLRILLFFCLSSVHVWHWQAAFCRCARFFVYRRSFSRR